MKTVAKNRIDLYENDLLILKKMKRDYNKTSGLLCGAFHSDMINEIDGQIKHVADCIKNLKK